LLIEEQSRASALFDHAPKKSCTAVTPGHLV